MPAFRKCSHEECVTETCTFYSWMTYEQHPEWGWVTICQRCDRMFPDTLPEEHAEERHRD